MDTALLKNPKAIAVAGILVLLMAYVGFSLGRVAGGMAATVGLVGVDEIPDGWSASIRSVGRLPPPELTSLVPATTLDSNAAWPLLRPAEERDDTRVQLLGGVHDRVHGGDSLLADDRHTWDGAVTDTTLPTYVEAAAFATFSNYVVEGFGSGDAFDPTGPEGPQAPFSMMMPDYSGVEIAALSMALRIHRAIEERQYNAAIADIRAIMGLGHLLAAGSPFLTGSFTGRKIVGLGADELAFYGDARGNTILVTQAERIRDWVANQPLPQHSFGFLGSVPDTALAIAGDPSVLPAWRAEAVNALVFGQMSGMGHLLGGPDEAVTEGLVTLQSDPDPQVAAVATVAARFLAWFGELGVWGRYRYLSSNLGTAGVTQ
jgi:hypothetical protein